MLACALWWEWAWEASEAVWVGFLALACDPCLLLCFQLLRKRHIGNDIVTIIFQEPGALPFTPKNIRSHFQHVFIIVRVHNPCTENVCYRYGHSVLPTTARPRDAGA